MNTFSSQDYLQPKSLASSNPVNFSQLIGEYCVHFTSPGKNESVTTKMSSWKSDTVAKISTVVPQVNTFPLCSADDVLLIEVEFRKYFTSKLISIFSTRYASQDPHTAVLLMP